MTLKPHQIEMLQRFKDENRQQSQQHNKPKPTDKFKEILKKEIDARKSTQHEAKIN